MRSAPVTVRSVIDSVEASLREQILDQEIPAGTVVRETEVARAFQVARPTAKAAIERLVAAGLLTRDVHRSARVPSLSADDVSDLYTSRSILEEGIVRRLSARRDLPESARRSIEDLKRLGTQASPTEYVGPDIEFHTALAGHVGSARLVRLHHGLMQEMHFCMAQVQAHDLLSPSEIVAEHERIAEAIAGGEPDVAARELVDHLERARAALVGFLAAQSDPSAPADSAGRPAR
jgi:DNA-binding GntR family transcriptional regulator